MACFVKPRSQHSGPETEVKDGGMRTILNAFEDIREHSRIAGKGILVFFFLFPYVIIVFPDPAVKTLFIKHVFPFLPYCLRPFSFLSEACVTVCFRLLP